MKPLQVITVAYNRPDFISLQYYCLSKYLKGPWIYLVFSDAQVNHEDNDHKIKTVCKKLHVQHIRVPPYIQTVPGPSPRAGNALDWALKNYAYNYDGFTLVMDSDMFLVQNFDPVQFMTNPKLNEFYDLAGVIQTMSHSGYWFRYLWMALLIINGQSMKNKNPDQIRFMNAVPVENLSTDAGGPMHYYLENHPDLQIKPLKHLWSGSWMISEIIELSFNETDPFCRYLKKEKDDAEIAGIGEMISNCFYHYRAGSNWNKLSPAVVDRRSKNLQEFMCSLFPPEIITGNRNRNFRFNMNTDMADYEINTFEMDGLSKGYTLEQLKIYLNDLCEKPKFPIEMVFLEPNSYNLPNSEGLEELFLIHETLFNENAILSLDFHHQGQEYEQGYDSDLTWPINKRDTTPKNFLRYWRPGMNENPGRLIPYALDPEILDNILGGKKKDKRAQVTTTMTRFPIKKQHHYQIVVIGKKLDPNVTVQLMCLGDTFFGALNAKEFSFGLDLTLIKWDFYNKFETTIDIGLEVKDNRVKKDIELSSTYYIRRAYLSCLGPLG